MSIMASKFLQGGGSRLVSRRLGRALSIKHMVNYRKTGKEDDKTAPVYGM